MSASAWALIFYAAWMVLLILCLGSMRVILSLTGRRAPNNFRPDGSDVSPFSGRLCRAHANCYEHFPIFGGLLIVALATNNQAITDPLAPYFVLARAIQTVIHLVSTSNRAVQLRFLAFVAQIAIALVWLFDFVRLGLA